MEKVVPRGKRPRVQVSLDDKERAIERIRNGETKAGISRELGVPESTVRGWVKRAEQRIARAEAVQHAPKAQLPVTVAASKPFSTSSPPPVTHLALQSLKLPTKRDYNGQILRAAAPALLAASQTLPPPLPLPVQVFNQAVESQMQVSGWLTVFNAGILNFTLIATAAYLQARSRGSSDRQTLWEIISDYVDEAGRMATTNAHYGASPRLRNPPYRGSFVAPRVHITAEDDEPSDA